MAGLYIHIPFCHSKCYYCDFYSTPSLAKSERVVDAIIKEMAMRRDEVCGIFTVYIGGGTPSILADRQIADIAAFAKTLSGGSKISEFTIEANPEDITYEKALLWRHLGINRVSMGLQSLRDDELKAIGRRHTAQQGIEAVETLRRAGIENLSLDLIYGLPNQTLETWDYSLTTLLDINPPHFSAYMLSYEPNTRLSLMKKRGEVKEADEELLVSMYKLLCKRAKEAGYNHYEISNFAKPQFEAQHNTAYWFGEPYLGVGPAAHSYDGKTRRINPSNISAYLAAIESGNVAYEVEEENEDNQFNDMLFTALRTSAGLVLPGVHPRRLKQLMKDAKPFLEAGQLRLEGVNMIMTEEAWLVSDDIISALFQI